MNKQIYPIHLSDYHAKQLILNKCAAEYRKAMDSHYSSRSRFEYSARLEADGSVKVHVHYSFDDGFCMGSGTLFDATIRPFNDEQLKTYKRNKILQLAEAEFVAREEAARQKKILKLAGEMFGDELLGEDMV